MAGFAVGALEKSEKGEIGNYSTKRFAEVLKRSSICSARLSLSGKVEGIDVRNAICVLKTALDSALI